MRYAIVIEQAGIGFSAYAPTICPCRGRRARSRTSTCRP